MVQIRLLNYLLILDLAPISGGPLLGDPGLSPSALFSQVVVDSVCYANHQK